MLPDVLTYLVVPLGVVGMALGLYSFLRPRLQGWRGLFPGSGQHEEDLRMMEEALSGIYRGGMDKEMETFRSYFSHGSGDEDEDDASFGENRFTGSYEGTGDYEEPAPADQTAGFPQDRLGVRTFSLANATEDDGAPRVLHAVRPPEDALIEPADEGPEPDSILDDPLQEPGSGDLEDLRSLFEESEEVHTVPEAVRNAVPAVAIDSLLAEAREIRDLLGASALVEPAA